MNLFIILTWIPPLRPYYVKLRRAWQGFAGQAAFARTTRRNNLLYLLIVPLLFLTSCGKHYKKIPQLSTYAIPFHISMPQNKHVLFNISPLIYNALYQQFDRIGYCMKTIDTTGFVLKTEVLEFEGIEKLISPDFLIYGSRLRLVLQVQLCDDAGRILVEQCFSQSTVFLRPKKSVFNSSYLEFVTGRLLRMLALRIENQLRTYMLPRSV